MRNFGLITIGETHPTLFCFLYKKTFSDDDEEEEEDQADHIDLTRVLPHLNFLTHVELSFGVKDVGMNFEWGFFTVCFLFRTFSYAFFSYVSVPYVFKWYVF